MPDREPAAGVLLLLHGEVEEELVREMAAEDGLTVMRRCADVAELLAAALAGLGSVAVVDSEFGIDRTVIDHLQSRGIRVLVRCPEEHVHRYDALGALGLAWDVPMIPAIVSLTESIDEAERLVETLPPQSPDAARETTPAEGTGSAGPHVSVPHLARTARVVAVIGAPGAPGRSTMAVNIAEELAGTGEPVMLIDADLWGGSLAQMLGMLADTAGLSAAVRAADQGTLDAASLGRLAPHVRPHLRLLPGLARASRWREVSATNLAEVLQAARRGTSWVVIEAPVLVPEEEAAFGFGPGRNEAAEQILAEADEIIVVGAGEPVGMERLVQTLLDLDDARWTGRRHVLVNRVRSSAAGPRAGASVQEALARFADVHDPVLIPDDRPLCDRSALNGTTWRETSGRSTALAAISDFAARLSAAGATAPMVGRRGRRRRKRVKFGRGRRAAAH